MHARVVAVAEEARGDELAVAAAAGATTLYVDDIADFDEAGGEVLIDGTLYAYDSIDEDADTIHLTAGLAAALSVGAELQVWDPTTETIVVEYVADCYIDGMDEAMSPLKASVDHALVPLLQQAIRGRGSESVTLERDGDDLRVTLIHGKAAKVDGNYLERAAIAAADGETTAGPFSGTSLPAGWSSTKTGIAGVGSPTGTLPGVSVISSGAPAGADGSVLLIDYGAAGLTDAALSGAGYVDTGLDAADALVAMRYRFSVNPPDPTDANLYIMLRQAGLPHDGSTEDAAFLDLSTRTPRIKVRINGADSTLATLTTLTNLTAEWHQVRFELRAGKIRAKVWAESETEPGWTTVDYAGVTTPGGVGVSWREFPFLATSTGQRAYIDYVDVTTYPVGFVVYEDGSGSWPAITDPLVARLVEIEDGMKVSVAAASPFSGSIVFARTGGMVFAYGNVTRAASFSTSFTDVCTIPDGYKPTAENSGTFAGQAFYNTSPPVYYRFRTSAGKVQVQQTGADATNMTINAFWPAPA